MKENVLLSMEEVRDVFKVTRKTLYSWNEKEYLKFFKLGGRNYYKTEDINNIINQFN
ncbi:helix-turn-helix domain-containing protein [Empedobacter falsenii]|uniref:helix-turn-helix domain-containing protein n=1 Tax=Empedobacter sedimenti TaxID=3042610 RepID=UPI0024A67481|nr:helix-turn-helix domain-containing protein [Empedobacter sedimenti]